MELVVVAPTSLVIDDLIDALTSDPAVRVEVVTRSSDSRPDERQQLAEAIHRRSVTGVVHLVQADGGDNRRPLSELDESDWIRLAEAPTWTLIETLQTVGRRAETDAPMIVVVEATGLSGEVGGTAASTTGEAARAVTKSAARQWGGEGPAVHIVAVDASVLSSQVRTAPSSRSRIRPEPTMTDLAQTIRAAIELPFAVGVTTLMVDGGRTMLP